MVPDDNPQVPRLTVLVAGNPHLARHLRAVSLLAMNAAIAKEVAVLSPDQRIELIGEIWNTLATVPEAVPVPESHWVELARRVAVHRAAPDALFSWEEVEGQVDERLRKRP